MFTLLFVLAIVVFLLWLLLRKPKSLRAALADIEAVESRLANKAAAGRADLAASKQKDPV